MNTSSLTTTTVPAVRFGSHHGYHFVADDVELNATFIVANRAAHDRSWALQLWACPSVPARSDDLVGHLVAEAPLPPISEISGETESFTVTASAQPPAGDRDHSMVLVLAARRGTGAFDEVHDVASFPTRERFLLPRFSGPVSYRLEGDRFTLELAGIENPRDASNLSGTISLEVWALSHPYSGGRFHGTPVAGAILGTLPGQDCWSNLSLDLPYTTPDVGNATLVAMVREWTGQGYTTRDFVPLGTLSRVEPEVTSGSATPAPQASLEPAAAAAPTPVEPPAAEPMTASTSPMVTPAVAPAPSPIVAATTPAAAAPAAKPATAAAAKVSLNTATVAQLAAVKGLPRAVAERILRDRPFAAVDDLLKVKGMGAKLLAKIRDQLTL